MKRLITILVVIAIVLVIFFVLGPFFILQEGEQAVIVQFGKIDRSVTAAGLHFKMPFVDTVVKYPKRILSWDGDPQQIPTKSNQFIWVDPTARWKIVDPAKYYAAINSIEQGYAKLDDIIDSSVRTVVSKYELDEIVRNTNFVIESGTTDVVPVMVDNGDQAAPIAKREATQKSFVKISKGRRTLSHEMLELSEPSVKDFGLDIIDVVIRQIRYSDQLTESVENRMIAERKQIAQRFRALGEGEKQNVLGKLENERQSIMSRAYSEAETIKGAAEAEVTKTYAQAYSVDREFFDFWRAFDSYKKTMPKFRKTLTTDMDYFKFLYNANAGQ